MIQQEDFAFRALLDNKLLPANAARFPYEHLQQSEHHQATADERVSC